MTFAPPLGHDPTEAVNIAINILTAISALCVVYVSTMLALDKRTLFRWTYVLSTIVGLAWVVILAYEALTRTPISESIVRSAVLFTVSVHLTRLILWKYR